MNKKILIYLHIVAFHCTILSKQCESGNTDGYQILIHRISSLPTKLKYMMNAKQFLNSVY